MGNTLTKRRSFYSRLKEERATGRKELRDLAAQKQVDDVDWPAVIRRAAELHQTEQQRLRRKQKQWERRKLRRLKFMRQKYGEEAGVYCINLLSINQNEKERFLDDEYDDSYSIYYTTETKKSIECGSTTIASTLEYATATESSTMECFPADSSTVVDELQSVHPTMDEQCARVSHANSALGILSDIATNATRCHGRPPNYPGEGHEKSGIHCRSVGICFTENEKLFHL